jgi:PleD family two-component response regulator
VKGILQSLVFIQTDPFLLEERRIHTMELETEAKLNILVVDDNPSTREVLTTLLSLEGHRCESAANGVEAMEKEPF